MPARFRIREIVAAHSTISTQQLEATHLGQHLKRVGRMHLSDLARPGARVSIAFTDATRACPDAVLIGLLIDELTALGVSREDITLLCATGLHRPMSETERLLKLGADICHHVRIVDHNAFDAAGLVNLGEIDGLPVVTNRLCVNSDVLIATGVVEPHQYAGYSGGAKTVVIGCGGEATIQATHSPAMLDHPGTRLGEIEGNPFQRFVRAAGARIGLHFALNVVLDESGSILFAALGSPASVHDELVAQARRLYEVNVPAPAHLALAGVEPVKAVNLYQASRAATYLALASNTPLLPGAPIILPAPIPEGAGRGAGEQRFFEMLSGAASPAQLVQKMRREGFPAGAQRAYVLAQVLMQHPIIVVGAERPDVVTACHMLNAPNLDAALVVAQDIARRQFHLSVKDWLNYLIVPHALLTLPRLDGQPSKNLV
ncbi:MAG: lactate racemase domain-containing protein [Anaerolineae bacterium]|nr:lactate racemase domain-containing protein [Thermoflexales bacterium]MDW8406908.1 lactate racemase domain-containing protein [Anaerolineae bacterium]